jgi:hypothetical protein
MGEGHSLINLGDISKPATVLIEKISEAIGGVFKPYQIKRVAMAETEAAITKAEGEIQVTDLQRRALSRFLTEEGKKQQNIESITAQAIPQLTDGSSPQDVENDWITNFFDKCRIVSDTEMQQLWAKVLAGEANSPGTYSKRTVNLIGGLDKGDAQLFTKLCGFNWQMGNPCPFVYDSGASIYADAGVDFGGLSHLGDIGLINFEFVAGFARKGFKKHTLILYYGTPIIIEFQSPSGNQIETGQVMLTKTGAQLAPICGAKPVDGFVEYVLAKWIEKGLVVASPYPRVIV